MNGIVRGWHWSWLSRFPRDSEKENFVRQVSQALYSEVAPTPVRNPQLVARSSMLASELGINDSNGDWNVQLLAGNELPRGARPYATRYGGHQFGHWAGQLGDGRAIFLGEWRSPHTGKNWEIQLKGSGPTPYSRRADGRAVLRSSLREYVCSEAMHALGVPTTRALSLVTTGEPVVRDILYSGDPKPEPGAIVCRVAPSFLRFGHFQILAANQEWELLKRLVDDVMKNHFPEFDLRDPHVYWKWLKEVAARTAFLVSEWMRVGFVHGVMNTDNLSIMGLTIDYGPYGFLEPFDWNWTPNTTDLPGRRYAYGRQADIAGWNLARLCESLFSLIPDEAKLISILEFYQSEVSRNLNEMWNQKLGYSLKNSMSEFRSTNESLRLKMQASQSECLRLFEESQPDFTLFFRQLSQNTGELPEKTWRAIESTFYQPLSEDTKQRWHEWFERRWEILNESPGEGGLELVRDSMRQVNPAFVFRNYLAVQVIESAEAGDFQPLVELSDALTRPYEDLPEGSIYGKKRPEWAENRPGCSALSCSS